VSPDLISGLSVEDWTWYGQFQFLDIGKKGNEFIFQYLDANGNKVTQSFADLDIWEGWARDYFSGRLDEMAGSTLAGEDVELFWELQKMAFLSRSVCTVIAAIDKAIETSGQTVTIVSAPEGLDSYDWGTNTLFWNPDMRGSVDYFPGRGAERAWHTAPAMVGLAHELEHCLDDLNGLPYIEVPSETAAMSNENQMRYALFKKMPGGRQNIFPRPGLARNTEDIASEADKAWRIYWRNRSAYPKWKK